MTKNKKFFDEEEFKKYLEKQFSTAMERGVIAGFKSALDMIVKDIDSGISIEELRERIVGKQKDSEIIEIEKYLNKGN